MLKRRKNARVEDFDLLIWRVSEDRFCARVRDPEGGLEAHSDFVHPLRCETLPAALEPEDTYRDLKGARRKKGDPARAIGTSLFQAVFTGEILALWNLRLLRAKGKGRHLRLRLHLNSPDLWELPWELLHDPKRGYLAVRPETPVVRYVEMMEPIRPLRVRPPIRVLAVSACPAGLSPLAIHEEHEDLDRSLKDLRDTDRVELNSLERATRGTLRKKLEEKNFHILHFIGHGTFDGDQGGAILLEGEHGQPERINGKELSALFHPHSQLRLVVLNVCEGARGSCSDPFAGLAQSLIQGGLPAVVAMQSPIPDRLAILFSHSFYESLAKREPVDLAVSKARNVMYSERATTSEWGGPVLAMRTPDGRIFDLFWWEVLSDAIGRITKPWKYFILALGFLALLGISLWSLGRRWLDPNLLYAKLNPPECPSPPDVPIAFVKIDSNNRRPFCMSRFEVTQGLWKRVMKKKIRSSRRGDALPVVRVSWYEANKFLTELQKQARGGRFRLPAQADWNDATGPGSPLKGSAETANCENKEVNDSFEGTAPVGSFLPNAWGLFDMVGNVAEWGSEADGEKRIVRGGSFENALRNCSITYWTSAKPDSRNDDVGFRIVRDPVPSK